MASEQLWWVEYTRKDRGQRKARRWRYIALAASQEQAIERAREEHRWSAMEEQCGGGQWTAEPHGMLTAEVGFGLVEVDSG